MTLLITYLLKKRLCWALVSALAASTVLLAAPAADAQSGGPPATGEPCLLYKSPVADRYEQVPLLHTDVSIDVRGLVAAATVTQQYANSSPTPIEAVYIFPLPHNAAVFDIEIRIGNRIIRSVIRERAEAKRVYEQAKSEGKRAALLEQERPNIFTSSIANIMPGDRITIQLRYVEPLQWEDGRLRLVFPMVVGPRYIPGTEPVGHSGSGWAADTDAVPDASRVTPVVRNPESRPGHDLSLAVDLDSGFQAAPVKCTSHEVKVTQLAHGRQRIELAAGATIPNRDFILEVQQEQSKTPQAALFLSPAADSNETHFLLAAFPPSAPPANRVPVEMLYMIDISGSMEGTSIQQAKAALLQALDRLKPTDRFGILAFNSTYQEFAPEPMPATAANIAAARHYVERLQANSGTEMLPALLHLMQKPATPGYLRHIIVLTDGDLGNEEQIFAALKQNLGAARLYTVAIGSAPNHFLATKMAQFGRGTFTHVAELSEIREQMDRLLATIENPVLTDIKVSFEGVETADIYPQNPPDLFLRQPLLIYGRIIHGRSGKVRLTARAGNEPYETTITFDASRASFHPGITTLWARQRVEELMDQWRQTGENGQAEIRSAVIEHAIRYRLVTRFTSLVAVEEVVVNAGGNNQSVAVPTELPAGMQMDKVFGAPATGTADEFFESAGIVLLYAGIILLYVSRRKGVLA